MFTRQSNLIPDHYHIINVPLILISPILYNDIRVEIPIKHSFKIITNDGGTTIEILFHEKTKYSIPISIYSSNNKIFLTEIKIITAHVGIQILRKTNTLHKQSHNTSKKVHT